MKPFESYYIQTFGCQMNTADSEKIAVLLSAMGMEESSTLEDASVVIINGCAIREKAVQKAVSAVGCIQKQFKKGFRPIVGLGGCVAQLDQEQLFQNIPYLDFVFGTDAIDRLPGILERVKQGERRCIDVDRTLTSSDALTLLPKLSVQAYVPIMTGCDKFCSYCIVPMTRGREKSRRLATVVDDVAQLVARGVKEVTLLGQNVNSFGKGHENETFPALLHAIDQDPRCQALKRIRFTSSHPLDFSDALIQCYAPVEQGGVARLAAQLHLPVQSGSDRILQKMSRHHSIATYQVQIQKWRQLAPQASLSTDFIVGFPTETEEDFSQTLKLMKELEFDQVYAFAYSARPGTRASQLTDTVPESVKKERLNRLLDLHRESIRIKNQTLVGAEWEVLVEGLAKKQRQEGLVWIARSSCHRIVHFVTPRDEEWTGQFLQVRILSATATSLMGEVVQ